MQQFYERKGTVCIPKVVRQEEKLAIGGFAILEQLHLAGNLSLEEGYETLLLQNNLKKYAFPWQTEPGDYVRTASGAAGIMQNRGRKDGIGQNPPICRMV